MPFEKGESGNPEGRPKGSLNKSTQKLRELLTDFLLENFEQVQEAFKELEPKQKVKVYTDLLKLAVPRPKAHDDLALERLTDQELDEMFDRLKEAAMYSLDNFT